MKKLIITFVFSSIFVIFCFGFVEAYDLSLIGEFNKGNSKLNSNFLRSETITLSNNSIEENQLIGAPIGLFEVDGYFQTYTCELSQGPGDLDNDSFTISDNQLLTSDEFDYEYRASYSINVSCSGEGLQLEQPFIISIINVYDITLSNNYVEENTLHGTYVGDFGYDDDYEPPEEITCIINDGIDDYLSFTMSGVKQLSTSDDFDYETKNLYSISVSCTGYDRIISSPYVNKIKISVNDINESPFFSSSPNTSAIQGGSYTYIISASDPDFGDILSISANIKPEWLLLTDNGNGTATLTGTPQNEDVGENSVQLLVTDHDGLTGTQSFNISVENINDPPIANAGDDQSVDTQSTVILDGSGSSDPDGDFPLIFQWTQIGGTEVLLMDAATVSPSFIAPDNPDTLTFSLVVKDSMELISQTDTVVITVNNQAPIADAGEDQSVYTRSTVILDGSGSVDPDGDTPLSYQWTQTAGTTVTLSDDKSASPSLTTPGDPYILTFSLVVTDNLGFISEADTVTITVNNQAPIADAGVDQTLNTQSLVMLDGSGSFDPDGDIPLSYQWIQIGGTSVTLSDNKSAIPSFTAPEDPDILTFSLVVTDDLGLSSEADSVVIFVEDNHIYLPLIIR